MADDEGSKVSISAVRKRKARKPKFVPVASATSAEALNLQPFMGHALADDIRRQVADALGVPADLQVDVGIERASARAARIAAADAREADAVGAVRGVGRKALKALDRYDREKPTLERAGMGVFDIIPAEMFDTQRVNERILMDWKSRAGGAGEMYARGQLGKEHDARRRLAAGAILCALHETASMSQVMSMPMQERVDGGTVDTSGARLRAAAKAAGIFRASLEELSATGRYLVENRVIHCKPMEAVVQGRALARLLGEVSVRKRCEKAAVLLLDALDELADMLPGMRA